MIIDIIAKYIAIIGWAGFSLYLISLGVLMTIDPKYRNYIANLWFKSHSQKEEQQHRRSVQTIGGPLYIVGGLWLLYVGLYVLGFDTPL